MRINHNIASMTTQAALFKVNRSLFKSIHKLSTGMRINSAADDAAGLGVSENLRTQVRGMQQAMKNTQDVIAILNIAEGALNEQADILQRMRELVIQAKNDTYTQTERNYMGTEFSHLMDELDRIAATANYNNMQIFATPELNRGTTIYMDDSNSDLTPHEISDGRSIWDDPSDYLFGANESASSHHFNMMIGQNYSTDDANAFNSGIDGQSYDKNAENMITIQFGQMDTNTMFSGLPSWGIDGTDVVKTSTQGDNAFGWDPVGDFEDMLLSLADPNASVQTKLDMIIDLIDGKADETLLFPGTGNVTGIERVNRMRAYIGAMTNRMEHTVNNLINQATNTQAAESIIRDVDFASETTSYIKNSILTQSATLMLAQANMVHQSVLQLIS